MSKRSKLIVRAITVKQSGVGSSTDEQMADKLTHVLKLSEQTDIKEVDKVDE